MPKIGMEPVRRKALINAAITAIGKQGSLEVRVSDIAQIAGVSSALAHHYFGSKEDLFEATLRHLLSQLKTEVLAAMNRAETPRAKLSAIVGASFSPSQFETANIAAWLNFYVQSMSKPKAKRLLNIYVKRLNSNLMNSLCHLVTPDRAKHIASGTAALIDGYWLRAALGSGLGSEAISNIESYLDAELAQG